MQISKNDVINILDDEITWNIKNNDRCKGLSKEYKKGYINALRDIKRLVNQMRGIE
jgi:hypothetical protein